MLPETETQPEVLQETETQPEVLPETETLAEGTKPGNLSTGHVEEERAGERGSARPDI